jgi:hypothetical protein
MTFRGGGNVLGFNERKQIGCRAECCTESRDGALRIHQYATALLCGILLVSTNTTTALAATYPIPIPGKPSQVAALVAHSTTIERVGAVVAAEIPNATDDTPPRIYPVVFSATGFPCVTATGCVFGDTKSKTTIVLYGDSHALMWLPALVPFAERDHYKVVLLFHQACPAICESP